MRLIHFLIIFIVISCASSEEASKNEKKAKIFYKQGTAQLQYKDYTKALRYLLQANKYQPNDAKILNNLGMAYYFKNAPDKAISLIKKSIEINPKNADARINLGTIYMRQGNFKKAKMHYKIVSKDLTYSGQFRTYYNLGLISLKTNDETGALKHFQKSVEIRPEYCAAHFQIGKIQFKRKNYAKAHESYKNASFGTCYNNPEPAYHEALSLIEMERFESAREKLTSLTERFALTPIAQKAQKKLNELSLLERQSILENDRKLFRGGKILTPDF